MKRKECFWWVFAIIGVCLLSIRCSNVKEDYCCYVNPFIGNADNGHTFPGACVPFGMIQVSPESGNGSWRYCSGFNIEDDSIMGFSQNHLNGTGCPDLGDILILPFCGDIQNEKYKSRYEKEYQKAHPGYYSVVLSDFGVEVELTATQRTAMHRYTFRKAEPAHILVDLQSGIVSKNEQLRTHVIDAEMQLLDQYSIVGKNKVKMWVEREFFYVIKFDKPYIDIEELQPQEGEKAKRLLLSFDLKPGENVQVKVGLSTVSIEGAQEALEKENIESRPVWKPMHMQPVFAKCDFIKVADKAVSEDLFTRGVCLPSDTKMTEEELRELVARGKVVIPANKNHKSLNPEGVGSMLRTKINVNLGVSRDCKDYDVEMEKVLSAVDLGAEAIMDLSSHGNTQPFRQKLTSECPAMIGTVPVYDSVIHYQRDLGTLTAQDFIDVVELHAKDGVDFVTLHCGITRKTIDQIKKHKRKMNIVS